MARYGIPRRREVNDRREGVNDNEPALINWRRGLFRVWVLFSAAWVMGWLVYLIMEGMVGGIQTWGDVFANLVRLIGPPIALLLCGMATAWAFRGFKIEGPPGA